MNLTLLQQYDNPQMTSEEFAAYCNDFNGQTYGIVDMVTTMNYLTTHNIWDRLKKIEIDPAKKERYGIDFVIRISKFLTTVQFYPATNYTHFVADTGALVFLNEITQEEADGFLALGARSISRYEEWGGEASVIVTAQHVNTMRNLDNIASLRNLEELLNSAHGDVLGVVQQARAALEAGELVDVPDAAQVVARFTATMEVV